jgi:hypothetical protein
MDTQPQSWFASICRVMMPLVMPPTKAYPATSQAAKIAKSCFKYQPACASSHCEGTHARTQATHTISKRFPQLRRHIACRLSVVGSPVDTGWKDDDFLEVGTLGRPHGVSGEVVVQVDTSFPEERFANPGIRYVIPASSP